MKNFVIVFSILLMVAVLITDAHAQAVVETVRVPKFKTFIHSGWQFRETGKGNWRAAQVPGCVHTDLLNNKVIEDPFYRDNEQKLQWIGKADWEYQTTFAVTPETLARQNIELVFEGLDTYADVTLNDIPLLSADNMFRTWRVNAKKALKQETNSLRIRFRSPINEILPVMAKLSYQLPAVNDQGEKTSPHTRKAPYQYGWDWGPRFVTSGIWRSVALEAWDEARIGDLRIMQKRIGKETADLTAEVEVLASAGASATLVIENVTDNSPAVQKEIKLAPGSNKFGVDLVITKPSLWWANGMGEQKLYNLRASLLIGGRVADEATRRTGLRTIELRQTPDEWGKSFEIRLNGVPVFSKGGNWIPADIFPTRITKEKYRNLLESVRDANMNMLRVWGGGIYEPDEFYEMCDELGIMVWQDFMFACSMYPGDEKFLENVRREAIDNVVRLRNHPSIVLWCGNNEIETAWLHWGWKDKLPAQLWEDYKNIFLGVLPKVVSEHDPARAYWSSSPGSNFEDDPDSQKIGDVHYWAVWHFAKPFEEYEKQFPRFMSEYGFQSFPSIETVNTYTIPSDHNIESPVMLAHQKHPRGNQLIREYMLRNFKEPKDFESFLYVSQVLQAEGIRIGAEHFRRIMPRNMGSLYWQINDCWPVASWSGMDYYGRWKALHYYARKFYKDILLSPHEEDGKINFYIVSDRVKAMPAELRVRLMNFDGSTLSETKRSIDVAALASKSYLSVPVSELLGSANPSNVFVHCELNMDGRIVSENSYFFRPFKELSITAPQIKPEVTRTSGGFTVSLKTDKFARAVYLSAGNLDGRFSDNFFDLIPGKKVALEFSGGKDVTPDDFRRSLEVRSLADAFKQDQTANVTAKSN